MADGVRRKPQVYFFVTSPQIETDAARRLRQLPSLHERTLLLTLVPLAVIAILVAVVTVVVAKGVLEDFNRSRTQMVLESLSLAMEPTMADHLQTQDFLLRAARNEVIRDLWLVAPSGAVIASSDPSAIGFPLATFAGTRSEHHVNPEGVRLVAEGDARIVKEIATVISVGAVATLGLGIAIIAGAVSRLSRALATPVANAALAATAMAEGDFRPAQELPSSSIREGEQLREALRHTARQLRDLTAGLEHQVATRTAQLEVANEHAQAARALAEEASRTKSMFLASMSHELRTPLNAIIGYAEIIAEELPGRENAGVQRDLGRIGQSARHLLALINDILDFTKLEAGRMRVHRETFAIRHMVEEVSNVIAPLVAIHQNQLRVEVSPQLQDAVGDALKIRQILINLLSNACKFTEGGLIHLMVEGSEGKDGRLLVMRVADTGIGMDEATRAQLFKPFINSESQRRHGGTGLGLAICAHYCQLMQGSIDCHSVRGLGSTFSVAVPLELPKAVEGTTRRIYRRTEVSAKPPSPTLNPDLQATWRAV
jgi:signal transduction histidine kinase